MVRHKKTKKKPVSSAVDPAAVSRKVTQSTISQFHTLLKQKSILKRQIAATGDNDENGSKDLLTRLVEIENSLEKIGGLKAYQEASRLGQADDRGGDSSKILVGWLREGAFAGKGKERESHEKIR
jgi:25S rRNA (adenine2142-N1)-methyltransferase